MRPEIADVLRGLPSPVCAYVYDTAVLRETAAAVRAALPAGTTLLYAVKANGNPAIVETLAAATDGLEVASGGELELAVTAGARRIAFGGPAKTDAELAAAVAAGAIVHVESVHELRRLSLIASRSPNEDSAREGSTREGSAREGAVGGDTPVNRVAVALRVNRRGGGLAGSHRMTGTPTPFGIDEDDIADAVGFARSLPGIDLMGFHLHAVSNNLDAPAHAAFIRDALAWSERTAAGAGFALRYVNVGGGFGVDYTGDATFDLSALDGISVNAGVELAVEPGRYLAAGAGWYAAEVLDLKRTHGRRFAVLRGGTHHFRLPAAWGYSHPFTVLPVERWRYPFPRPEVRDTAVDAVGELCTPRDVLARDQHVDRLRVGDILVFGKAGAYGWDISHHDFLRHGYPEMIVL